MDENTAQENSAKTLGIEEIASKLGLTAEVALSQMKQALNMEEEMKNAEAQGYLRGRNEKIELMTHPHDNDDEPRHTPAAFPRFHRRSVWDC